jgi:hypothetical protein
VQVTAARAVKKSNKRSHAASQDAQGGELEGSSPISAATATSEPAKKRTSMYAKKENEVIEPAHRSGESGALP